MNLATNIYGPSSSHKFPAEDPMGHLQILGPEAYFKSYKKSEKTPKKMILRIVLC